MGTFILPLYLVKSSNPSMEAHLAHSNMPGMAKTNKRRIEKMRAKKNTIVIVKQIGLKTLLKMGKDCQLKVISRDNFEKTGSNHRKEALCH